MKFDESAMFRPPEPKVVSSNLAGRAIKIKPSWFKYREGFFGPNTVPNTDEKFFLLAGYFIF